MVDAAAPKKKKAASATPAASTSNGTTNGAGTSSTAKGKAKATTNGVNGTVSSATPERKPTIKRPVPPKIKLKGDSQKLYDALMEHEDEFVDPKPIWRKLKIANDDAAKIINDLSQLVAQKDKTIMVKAVAMDKARKRGALEEDAKLVMDSITRGGNRGAWTRYIVRETGLTAAAVEKILKKLTKDNLVKQVSSVRRIYMLSDIEPSVELTGGPWYADNALDEDFVDNLLAVCDRHIRERTFPPTQNKVQAYYPLAYDPFLPHARELLVKIGAVLKDKAIRLTVDDVETLMHALVADGLIERIRIERHEGDIWALDEAEEQAERDEVEAKERKRKRKTEAGPSTKRVRHAEPDSDHVDESGAENEEQSEDDDDDLPPPLQLPNGSAEADQNGLQPSKDHFREGKAGPPGRKPYFVYRSIHRVKPAVVIERENAPPIVPPIPTSFLGHRLGLVADSPCGSCPVRQQCDNRGHPLPTTTSNLAETMTRSLSPASKLASLALKAPQSHDDHADGIWRGGGTKGRERLGPINPTECLYFESWFKEQDGLDW